MSALQQSSRLGLPCPRFSQEQRLASVYITDVYNGINLHHQAHTPRSQFHLFHKIRKARQEHCGNPNRCAQTSLYFPFKIRGSQILVRLRLKRQPCIYGQADSIPQESQDAFRRNLPACDTAPRTEHRTHATKDAISPLSLQRTPLKHLNSSVETGRAGEEWPVSFYVRHTTPYLRVHMNGVHRPSKCPHVSHSTGFPWAFFRSGSLLL